MTEKYIEFTRNGGVILNEGQIGTGFKHSYFMHVQPQIHQGLGHYRPAPSYMLLAAWEPGATFGFDIALALIKQGYKLARAGWNGKGMYVQRGEISSTIFPGVKDATPTKASALMLYTAQGTFTPWTISGTDALASDWSVVE